MCDVMTALSIGSTVVGLYGQQQEAKAQEKYNNDLARNAVTANNQRNAQINMRQIQERDAAAQKVQENNREAMKSEASAQVAASSAGVSGVSVDSLLSDIGSSQGRYNASVGENLRATNVGEDWDRVNAQNDMQSTFNSMQAPKRPNYLGAALQIGTSVDKYNTKSGGKLWSL